MNTQLFKSAHGLAAGLIVLVFGIWLYLAEGWQAERTYQLASGWMALALFLVVLCYVMRKNVHKLGISPEFKMRVPIEKLERAESRLSELRVLMSSGRLQDRADIMDRCKLILRQEGVQRVVKVRIETGAGGQLVLRAMPTDPLGRLGRWMHAHLYYGLAAGCLVALHGGFASHSGIARMLNGLTILVVFSGLGGVILWAVIPQLLTAAERDLSIEKAHALLDSLNTKIASAYDQVDANTRAVCEDVDQGNHDFNQAIEAARRAAPSNASGNRGAEDLMALLGQRRQVRSEWKTLMRIKQRMHFWRVIHVPGALLLAAIIVVHVVSVLWY